MGSQDGIIQLRGRVGNVTFFKTKNGYAARKASGVDGNKIRNHPAYERTRENMVEFDKSVKATQMFRAAFIQDIKTVADGQLYRRLTSLMSKLVRQDKVNARGQRKIQTEVLAALEGFEFNRITSLKMSVKVPFTASINRATGALSVDIPAFSPKQLVSAPDGATHFVFSTTGAEIDFEAQTYQSMNAQSAPIPIDEMQHEALQLTNSIPASTKPLFLSFGISFVQVINGISYPLKTSQHLAMQLVKVDLGLPS